jgi:hypothetical protein
VNKMFDDSLGGLGLLQAYRKNPFSLWADMGRDPQLLPPDLPQFVYKPPQPVIVQQAYGPGGPGTYNNPYGNANDVGYEGNGIGIGPGPDSATDPSSVGAVNGLDAASDAAGGGGGGGAK